MATLTVHKINANDAAHFAAFLRKDPLGQGDIIQTNDGKVHTLDKEGNPATEPKEGWQHWWEIRDGAETNVVGKSDSEVWLVYCCDYGNPSEPRSLEFFPAEINTDFYRVLDLEEDDCCCELCEAVNI